MPLLALLCLLLTLLAPPVRAADLPPELAPWASWVLERHPDLHCPVVDGSTLCIWPGELQVAAGDKGGSFTLELRTDRKIAVPLPGGQGAWPQAVRAGGQPVVVLDVGGIPMATLDAGRHEVTGSYAWDQLPPSLRLPPQVGMVALAVRGEAVAWPTIDAENRLRLGPGEAEGPGENRLDIEVSRRITDGVPVVVETQVALRASGTAREMDLGKVLLPGTRPVSITADIPARFTPEGSLIIQVRPGSYQITFQALHEGEVMSLSAPGVAEPWPPQEFWAVAIDDRVRAVDLSGPASVDPSRTPLPEAWRGLPTFLVNPSQPLVFSELRRGEPMPAPNRLTLQREMWLDMDGGGLTVRDTFAGRMNQGWRLDTLAPAELGHVVVQGQDQVITRNASGQAGVELRKTELGMVAESRIGNPSRFPAVGWNTDVNRLSATLHLPPGWSVLAGWGVDSLSGSILEKWKLFDLFFVLIVALATQRLVGWRWGLVALAALVISRHERNAPAWIWAILLFVLAMERLVKEGTPRVAARVARWTVAGLLFVLLLPFAVRQIRLGLFPVLEQAWVEGTVNPFQADGTVSLDMIDSRNIKGERFTELNLAAGEAAPAGIPRAGPSIDAPMEPKPGDDVTRGAGWEGKDRTESSGSFDYGGIVSRKRALDNISLQYDPSSVANTGFGVPVWTWNQLPLEWTGPVTAGAQVRLLLLGPMANGFLAFARVLLLLALALRLAGFRREHMVFFTRKAPVGLGLLLAALISGSAMAAPSPELLSELETRLVAEPTCRPACVAVPRSAMSVVGERLVIEADVHAATDASWPVPGPASTWVPASVTVDGSPAVAMARLPDGFLHVRLDPGVHRIRAEGPLPPLDALTLRMGIAPALFQFTATGWTLDGRHADGTVERSVQITRQREAGKAVEAASSENLAPWVEVRRFLDLGLPWRVRTEVARIGPSDAPLSLKIPLLPGEAVTDDGIQVSEGAVRISLDRDRKSVSWLSTLDEVPSITLTAPTGVPWTEQWTLSCSPIFACDTGDFAPLEHVQENQWFPRWRPWPGETLGISVTRPEAVAGQTTTLDRVRMELTPGRGTAEGVLYLQVRTSGGGQQVITLPARARLQEVLIDGKALPIQAQEGRIRLPLKPGTQGVRISWQQEQELGVVYRVPQVDLGAPAVNVSVVVNPPAKRWTLFLLGPSWGPVPLFWSYLVLILMACPLLARLPGSPLKTWQWVLLGLGMTQVPVAVPVLIVLWFMAMGFRHRRPLESWWSFDLYQVMLLGLSLAFVVSLCAAVWAGLMVDLDMQIQGNNSNNGLLQWFVDRVDGRLPAISILSVPSLVWRAGMLAWSLWLAASLLRWLPWAWRAMLAGGSWFKPPPDIQSRRPTPPLEPEKEPVEGNGGPS